VIGRYKCSAPKAQRIYEEIEDYRRQFVDVVRKALKSGSAAATQEAAAR
jgi:hypothetical protein